MFEHLNTVFAVPGYRITQQIYLGSKTLVYRGIREKDQQSVILKLMRNEYPTFHEITQFRNQYSITKNLHLTGVVKPYSLENYRNSYALILEDFGGVSLTDYVTSVEKLYAMSLQQFFHVAIQITSTLNELHRHRIIHKDIKPANILIHPTTLEVKLIDFSLASLLPKEIQHLTNPNFLEGTLAYISPEQTGRMNRGIDYRSDFYSLGVTFFELLTGQLPFITADPIELVYCHIAKLPPNASDINKNIPLIVSDIISKLMAKNAEDRYQSALGLKRDLEVCLQQWEETANITIFKLGQQDVPDRFLIPEKLYGRKQEVETLLSAFDRVTGGTTEMVLIAGASGIGKTAVVNEVHKPIVRQHSYFIKGKFDQFQRDIPLSGFVQAFQDLIRQVLCETDAILQKWKARILEALGTQAQVIIDVIPNLKLIIGFQAPVTELSGTAAQNRFNLLFQRFIKVFSTKEHPLVIFLDDLQWADTTSLKFIHLLISQSSKDKETDALLLIGAYRDNEVPDSHPLYLTINEIKKTGNPVNTITLTALNQNNLEHLIADTLRCQEAAVFSLTQLVFAKTKGNPFFIHQFLKVLFDEGVIQFNSQIGYWEFEMKKFKALTLTDDVVEFMALQLEKLPSQTQEVLKLAASIGNCFDLKTLAIVHQKSEVDTAADLWTALVEGLVLPQSEVYKFYQDGNGSLLTVDCEQLTINGQQLTKYKFIHDRIQQASYSLIPKNQKQFIHLRIGKLLLSNTSLEERERNIFELVNQLNMAVELITDRREQDELVKMNLIAGRKAMASTAYAVAVEYLKLGIQLLPVDSWKTNYAFALTLYETAAEVAYLNGNFEQTNQLVEVVLAQAKTLLDKVKVNEIKMQAYGAQNQPQEAVHMTLAFLKSFGVEFPENPNHSYIQQAIAETTSHLVGKSIKDLIHLPEMTESLSLAVMRLLSGVTTFSYQVAPEIFALIVIKQIDLSLKYGNAPFSCFAYVTYAMILCGVVEDIDSSYQFGQLALSLLMKFDNKQQKAKIIQPFNTHIRHWKEHTKEILEPLLKAYSSGLEVGDLEFAAYSLNAYCYSSFLISRELTKFAEEIASYTNALAQLKQKTVFLWNAIFQQVVLNLLSCLEHPYCLSGEVYDEEKMMPIHQQAKDGVGLLYLYFCKLYLCYLFQEFSQAVENANKAEKCLEGRVGLLVMPFFYFYDSLARLAIYPTICRLEQKFVLDKVQVNQEKMQHWAAHAPMNNLHKFYLVQAEYHRVLGQYLEAMDDYDRAITLAQENEYINEAALANELAAKFYLERGKPKIAQIYLTEAYYNYIRWGAIAKVSDLERRYPQLLASILQEEYSVDFHQKNISSNSISLSTNSTKQNVIRSNTSISGSLDLASVIKASVALSGEIEMEQLMSILMQVVMENAGSSKCVLILNKDDRLYLAVTAVNSTLTSACNVEFPSTPLESSGIVPMTLINYVKRTQEILVVDDLKDKPVLAADSYIILQQPKSILCIPVINQGKLLGILYFENDLTTGAFTYNRVELLKLISTQAAISLENAILYQNLTQTNERLEEYNHKLEDKVAQRTQELNKNNQRLKQALLELQNTQAQLIQSEKMSSLGEMMAGIAHEINNPINFIHGNVTHVREYVKDLLNLIAIYQQESPHLSPSAQEKAIEIDLDFLVDDLPKLLNSMSVGTTRIQNIVLSLRNFSRLHEADMKPVDIHEGIDNTLMILHHRFKPKSNHPEIEVIKEYGQLPSVTCYASELNQVFMNILSNAIDALEQGVGTLTTPQIRICTELINNNTVRILFADNGCGMTSEVQQKIFDPFFTTKPVGSGTGLGLSISYQIVVDKHKGNITCDSVLGKGSEFIIEIPIQ